MCVKFKVQKLHQRYILKIAILFTFHAVTGSPPPAAVGLADVVRGAEQLPEQPLVRDAGLPPADRAA